MKVAVANNDEVSCPGCSATFEVDSTMFGAVVECPTCSCEFRIDPPVERKGRVLDGPVRPIVDPSQARTTSSGIEVGDVEEEDFRPMSTVKLTRSQEVMDKLKGNVPAPVSKDVSHIESVEADRSGKHIKCPKCRGTFEVVEEFFGTVGECPDCGAEFIIARPGQAAGVPHQQYSSIRVRAATGGTEANVRAVPTNPTVPGPPPVTPIVGPEPDAPVTSSGIEMATEDELAPKRYQATATVRLTRDMTMVQQRKQERKPPPPPERVAKMKEVSPVNDSVTCPGCKSTFEITEEYYGVVAECPDCSAEFLIRPPAPARPAAPAKPAKPAAPPTPPKAAAPVKAATPARTASTSSGKVKGPAKATPAGPGAVSAVNRLSAIVAEKAEKAKAEAEAAKAEPPVAELPEGQPAASGSSKAMLYVVVAVGAIGIIGLLAVAIIIILQ